jgi:hypothetical protein
MKRFIKQLPILALTLFVATSCLDIQESIYLRNNGSGKFALTVDLEGMESLLKVLDKLGGDESTKKDVMEEVDINFSDLQKELAKQPGISQVRSIRENDNRLLGIAFEFRDVNALNNALKEINDSKNKDNKSNDYFSFQNGELKRMNTLGIKEQVQRKVEADVDIAIDGVMLTSMLQDMSYTTKYTFEKPVQETSNPGSKITNEGRTVTLTYFFFNEETGSNTLENQIRF